MHKAKCSAMQSHLFWMAPNAPRYCTTNHIHCSTPQLTDVNLLCVATCCIVKTTACLYFLMHLQPSQNKYAAFMLHTLMACALPQHTGVKKSLGPRITSSLHKSSSVSSLPLLAMADGCFCYTLPHHSGGWQGGPFLHRHIPVTPTSYQSVWRTLPLQAQDLSGDTQYVGKFNYHPLSANLYTDWTHPPLRNVLCTFPLKTAFKHCKQGRSSFLTELGMFIKIAFVETKPILNNCINCTRNMTAGIWLLWATYPVSCTLSFMNEIHRKMRAASLKGH